MRKGLLLLTALAVVGCGQEKVDISHEKSPDAGAKVENKNLSTKPSTPPYKTEKGGGDTSVIVTK